MENMIEFKFQEKVIKDVDGELKDYIFQGIRCTDDVMYKFCYFLGLLMDLPEVYLCIDEGDTLARWKVPIGEQKQIIDEDAMEEHIEDNVCDN